MFVLFLLAIVLSVILRVRFSDDPFVIFKPVLRSFHYFFYVDIGNMGFNRSF